MATLQSLPTDVKYLICAELERAQSVRPLWQVSQAWRAVAEPFVFRGLVVSVSLKDGLDDDVKRLTEDGIARKYLKHARYIHINDHPKPRSIAGKIEEDNEDEDSKYKDSHKGGKGKENPKPTGLSSISTASFFADAIDKSSLLGSTFIEPIVDTEKIWKPFITVLVQFQHLTDIVLDLGSRFPPGLISAIETHHPTCRLHLRNFRFKTLNEEVTDPDERALARSKTLHSLSIKYAYRDSSGIEDHNGAAALRTVSLAPNLKHVTMLGRRPASSAMLHRARHNKLKGWKGFKPDDQGEEKKEKTKLETLNFMCLNNTLSIERLEEWEQVVDFTKLKILTCSTNQQEFLRKVALHDTFPELKELDLTLEPSTRNNLEEWEPAVEQFFAALPPLSSLKLAGTMHASLLEVIAGKHGASLQKLSLEPFYDGYDMPDLSLRFTAPIIEMLASKCPHLTSLVMNIRRSMGDRTETRCYEALGTFQHLQDLKLRLDCSNKSEWDLRPEEDWDDFDKTTQTSPGSSPKSYNGFLKIAMVNSALDETLVREIWAVLNEHRTKDRLETLCIYTYGGSSFANSHPGDLMNICSNLSRSYKLTSSAGAEDGVDIVETSKAYREESDARDREHERTMVEKWGHKGHNGGSYAVFKHLWPHGDEEDWRLAWRSWPLQRGPGDGDGKTRMKI